VERHRKELGGVDTSPIAAQRISLQRSVASGSPEWDASTEVMRLWSVTDAEGGLAGRLACDETGREKWPESSGDGEREKWIAKQLLSLTSSCIRCNDLFDERHISPIPNFVCFSPIDNQIERPSTCDRHKSCTPKNRDDVPRECSLPPCVAHSNDLPTLGAGYCQFESFHVQSFGRGENAQIQRLDLVRGVRR
jgi:hypothetical protein